MGHGMLPVPRCRLHDNFEMRCAIIISLMRANHCIIAWYQMGIFSVKDSLTMGHISFGYKNKFVTSLVSSYQQRSVVEMKHL